MRDTLEHAAPDLVHAHWTYEFELAAQDSGLPHVTTAHDSPVTILRQIPDWYRAARLVMAAKARPGIRLLSAVAPYLADRWNREMRYPRAISVIPNSIPTDVVPGERTPATHPVVLEVADAGRLKNVRGLLRAFRMVRAEIRDAELRLVGPGLSADDALARWARRRQLSSGVTFVGRLDRENLRREYARAWVFAHASFEEACPMTLLESLGANLPIVGGISSGGVPYVLDYGRAGTLTDVACPHALAQSVLKLIDGGPRRLGAHARFYAAANFSPQAVAREYVRWYEQLA